MLFSLLRCMHYKKLNIIGVQKQFSVSPTVRSNKGSICILYFVCVHVLIHWISTGNPGGYAVDITFFMLCWGSMFFFFAQGHFDTLAFLIHILTHCNPSNNQHTALHPDRDFYIVSYDVALSQGDGKGSFDCWIHLFILLYSGYEKNLFALMYLLK